MLSKQITMNQFQARATEFLQLLQEAGGTLVIIDDGKPILEIRPYPTKRADALDRLRGTVLKYVDPTVPIAVNWLAGG